MANRIFYLSFIIIILNLLFFNTYAQNVEKEDPDRKQILEERKKAKDQQSKQSSKPKLNTTAAKTDTSKKSSPFAKRDTLITQKINSQVFWYDIENALKTRRDFASEYAFRFNDEKKLLYRNMSDIFRQQPLWYVYNFMESGRPAYISGINTFPHQTAFYYNGVIMNDPIHGMFNSQYVPVNFIRNVQLSTSGNNLQDYGSSGTSSIHVVPSSRHTKAPWSKILYKQGNYGYSDLDISFVHPATPDLSIQLGGINRLHDGATFYNNRHGTNYRGELTWQIKENLFLRSQFFLNRERVGVASFSENTTAPYIPRQIDLRDDYFLDITWLPTDTISQRAHLTLFNTYSIRRLKDDSFNNSSYHNRYEFKRYGFDANYNFEVGGFNFLAGGGTIWNRVWGTGFNKQYFPAFYNTYGKLTIPIYSGFAIKPQAQITFNEEFEPQLSLSVSAENAFDAQHHFTVSASRTTRYPNATEKYFNSDSILGNRNLINEDFIVFYANYKTSLFDKFKLGMTVQYNLVKNEILFQNYTFRNGNDRDFLVFAADLKYSFWKFDTEIGGFENISDFYLTSRRSGWLKLHFGDIWLNNALGVDAYATIQYWGERAAIKYEPVIEKFHWLNGSEKAYSVLNWKVVATVQDARIFFEMDNSLSETYEIINRYSEFTQRWRFGVHWILWN